MSKQQLENLRKSIGANNPNLEETEYRLLHLHAPLGGFNEWIVLTYNLQVLGEYIMENIKLRKEITELMETYMKQVLVLGNAVNPGASNMAAWSALFSMNPNLGGSGLPSFPFPNQSGSGTSFPNSNMARWLALLSSMNSNMPSFPPLNQSGWGTSYPISNSAGLLAMLSSMNPNPAGSGLPFPSPNQSGSGTGLPNPFQSGLGASFLNQNQAGFGTGFPWSTAAANGW